MIKAIIMDVDGVIVGKTPGVNFPLPNSKVINALKVLRKKNIPVILCTAKFSHAIKEIIIKADLCNPHITDAGALILDPLENSVIKKHIFDKTLAHDIVEKCIANGFYTEVYGVDSYYLQKDHIDKFTQKRIKILQKKQVGVDSLIEEIDAIEVIKIKVFAHTKKDQERIEKNLSVFKQTANIFWSYHPYLLPTKDINITPIGVSKKAAAREVLQYVKITPDETLGIGDTEDDWKFMSLCGYAATLANGSGDLKKLVKSKENGKHFVSNGSVDQNGILEIFNYFLL